MWTFMHKSCPVQDPNIKEQPKWRKQFWRWGGCDDDDNSGCGDDSDGDSDDGDGRGVDDDGDGCNS